MNPAARIVVMVLVLAGASWSAPALPIRISVSPLAEFYHLGEPIEVRLALENTTAHEVRIRFHYPEFVGVSFSCKQPGVIPIAPPVDIDRAVPLLGLKGKEEYRRMIALNRYLKFQKPGSYSVTFEAHYRQPSGRGLVASEGQFAIDIRPGPVDRDRLREHIRAIRAKDPLTAEDAAEMLLWADDPVVIEPLVRAAKRVPGYPKRAIRALEKFFQHERARAAILEVGSIGTAFALRAALQLFDEKKAKVPLQFCEARLASGSTSHQYALLDYLTKRGGPEHIPLVKPFADHRNPRLRRLALRFLTKVKQQSNPRGSSPGTMK